MIGVGFNDQHLFSAGHPDGPKALPFRPSETTTSRPSERSFPT